MGKVAADLRRPANHADKRQPHAIILTYIAETLEQSGRIASEIFDAQMDQAIKLAYGRGKSARPVHVFEVSNECIFRSRY